jgi:hypothetical protein
VTRLYRVHVVLRGPHGQRERVVGSPLEVDAESPRAAIVAALARVKPGYVMSDEHFSYRWSVYEHRDVVTARVSPS